jgi:hypothetical protein
MTHHITKDTVKGIIRIINRDLIQHHDLWGMSRDLVAELDGAVVPKILMDLREATIKVEDWEKKQFAEAHKGIIGRKAKIAALIKEHDPQYREYLHFEVLFANLGVRVRIFDDERRAESWLQLPL